MSVKKVNSGLLEFADEQKVFIAIDEDSEVKKAVVIDEDGDETSFLDPGVVIESLTATENKTYNAGTGKAYNPVVVNVPQPTGKITITENGENIDIAQYATADVAVEGNFSTAELTVNATIESSGGLLPLYLLYLPVIETNEYISENPELWGYAVYANGENSYQIVLYNDGVYYIEEQLHVTAISGNIEQVGEGQIYYITGDCSITVTNAEPQE